MTKDDIIDRLYEKDGLLRVDAQKLVETLFDTVRKTLVAGKSVKVAGYGLSL